MRLLPTEARGLGAERLLNTATVLEDKINSPGGAREAVNNSTGGNRGAVNNRSSSAGSTREVVNNMKISAGGAREVGDRRRNSAWEASDFDNMTNSIARAKDAF